MKNIQLEINESAIGIARMDMPGRPFNVFSEDMMDDLETLINTVEEKGLKGLVVGSGKSAYAAGADLAMIEDFTVMRFRADDVQMRERFSRLGRLYRRLEKLPIPVVAAVNGLALGGGLELALACHYRVCVDIDAPILGLPEISLGLLPGAGGTQRLPRLVGIKEGAKMLLDGLPKTPQQAKELGFVDELASAEQLIDVAVAIASKPLPPASWDREGWSFDNAQLNDPEIYAKLAANNGWTDRKRCLYTAANAILDCIVKGGSKAFDAGCDEEWDIFVGLMKDPIAGNMVRSLFLTKTGAAREAGKLAKTDQQVANVFWGLEQSAPKGLSKKFNQVDLETAEVAFVSGEAASDAAVQVCDVLSSEAGSNAPEIRLLGNLAGKETVELAVAGTPVDALVAQVLSKSRITPVAVAQGTSPTQSIAKGLQAALEQLNLTELQLAAAVDAVELGELCNNIGQAVSANVSEDTTAWQDGNTLLLAVSLSALESLKNGVVATAAMLDYLAVHATGFPKWAGGPAAYLDMVKRGEIEGFSVPADMQAAVDAVSLHYGV